MQDVKMPDQVAGHENDGPSKLQVVKMQAHVNQQALVQLQRTAHESACARLQFTMQHRTVLIIFFHLPDNRQSSDVETAVFVTACYAYAANSNVKTVDVFTGQFTRDIWQT